MKSYMGKILRVNLSTKAITTEPLNFQDAEAFLGGRGLGTKILLDEIDPQIDALSEENKLLFVTGPLTGTATPTGGRYMVVTKSPLTGTVASSNSGGFWGSEFKACGYDLMIVEGKADRPAYIHIEDDKVELRDAAHIWGRFSAETTQMLEKEIPERGKVLCIGPAGEKLSLMASVINDVDRAAGRSGVGAVMGSKNLKAITVKGSNKVEVADGDAVKNVVSNAIKMLRENGVTGTGLPTYGTAVLVNIINEQGVMPVNNFQGAQYPEAEKISGETMTESYLTRKHACYRCPIACGRVVARDGKDIGGPEYETLWSFGSDCGVDDMSAIIEANFWCNEYGLDTISVGSTIAAAMELEQRGFITESELGGLPLKFGDAECMVEWTKRIGAGEGLGADMAQGSYRLCEKYGVPELSMSVKKQELPAYDPRGIQGQAVQYATSNRGGCHVRGYMISPEILGAPQKLDKNTIEGKALWAKTFQDLTAVIDSLGMCLFTSFALGAEEYTALYNAATGQKITSEELMKIGERIYNIERVFNIRAGIDGSQDTLPPRLLKVKIPEGPSKGEVARLSETLPEYYAVRGWVKGAPTSEKLTELGL